MSVYLHAPFQLEYKCQNHFYPIDDEAQWLVWLWGHAMGGGVKRWEGWVDPNTLLTNILGQVYNSNEGPHKRQANAHPRKTHPNT